MRLLAFSAILLSLTVSGVLSFSLGKAGSNDLCENMVCALHRGSVERYMKCLRECVMLMSAAPKYDSSIWSLPEKADLAK